MTAYPETNSTFSAQGKNLSAKIKKEEIYKQKVGDAFLPRNINQSET